MSRKQAAEDSLEGNYAGAATRLAAFAADSFFIVTSYGFLLALVVFVFNLMVRNDDFTAPAQSTLPYIVGLLIWIFLYNGVCWALWWKTPGMSLLGLRVVERDGSDLRVRTGFRRAFWWQACFLVPFSQIGIVIGRERRALHDVLAGTTVVYDWNARDARWRLMARGRTGAPADMHAAADIDAAARVDTAGTDSGTDRAGADDGHR